MKELSLRQKVFKYMEDNPNTSNTAIQLEFINDSPNSVKTYRTQWNKEKKNNKPGKFKEKMTEEEIKEFLKEGGYTKINADTIEAVLLEGANTGDTSMANLARCMIDFVIKIKGKTDEIDENIDMEALKAIGINITSSN
ncbi:hypothetical protein LCGC14_1244440 [marine sediment metagenome]|uniref:Uncharacterized protein n=1 Tax=marine sediment metagenome TaxID=412755 RepID=A0A0F9L4W6_9ZZZZ